MTLLAGPLLAALAATAVACELLLRLPLRSVLDGYAQMARRSASVMGSRHISDHWKEKALLAYAGRLARLSVVSIGILLAIAAPFAAAGLLPLGDGPGLMALLLDPLAGLSLMGFAAVYIFVRRRFAGG